MLPPIVTASILQFDDIEKQRKYETISFEEVYNAVVEIKVISPSTNFLASNWCFVAIYLSPMKFLGLEATPFVPVSDMKPTSMLVYLVY